MELILKHKTLVKIALIMTAGALLWFGTFGLMFHMDDMKKDASTSGCLFDSGVQVCNMNYSEHIANWQSLFTSLPQNVAAFLTLILSVTFLATVAIWRDKLFEFYEQTISRWKIYIKEQVRVRFFEYLREAFSQGILNPKLYWAKI